MDEHDGLLVVSGSWKMAWLDQEYVEECVVDLGWYGLGHGDELCPNGLHLGDTQGRYHHHHLLQDACQGRKEDHQTQEEVAVVHRHPLVVWDHVADDQDPIPFSK